MVKAIIFDFDGTLSNRQLNAYLAYKNFLKDFFDTSDEIKFESVLQDMLAFDMNGIIKPEFRIAPFMYKYKLGEDFKNAFNAYWRANMYKFVTLREEVPELIERLKKKYKVGVISNGDSFSQNSKITHSGLRDMVDEVLVSGDLECAKPQKEIFDLMANKLGVKNEECVFVGDIFSSDIIGATNAKMIPVWKINDNDLPTSYKGYRIKDINEIEDIITKID